MNKQFKALIHSFSSGKDLAKAALDLGFYISLSGIVTFKNAKLLQEIVQYLPIDRILVETGLLEESKTLQQKLFM
jgi:TatD DNase family protein